jgi:hypothetical protein
MKTLCPPQSGKRGDTIYLLGRYGQVAKAHTVPRNPRTERQQNNRASFGSVSSRWRLLTPEQRAAWSLAAASHYTRNRMGRAPLNGYNYFVKLNASRASKGLGLFDLPPAVPTFSPNPVGNLSVTTSGGEVSLKLNVPSQPAQYTLVYGAAPVSPGVSCVQHFVFLGFLPPAVNGWSDISALYQARYPQPLAGRAVHIRSCQHIDGFTDLPKQVSAIVPAA